MHWQSDALTTKLGLISLGQATLRTLEAQNKTMAGLTLTMEPWRVCRQVFEDPHHFDEEQDPNPAPHLREKSNPGPQLNEHKDLDPH